ncbi:ubiquitin carboxyl-terminal hydrolase [Striga asiatica]|uniref:ubiquitinyl hydrolase 1 n=1 Tax=Striga asiatica TaxID=4170 RepID=A0A5A7PFL7_STRAF|nr:ubiquitin carboxyl-terminal hydrolase [Striga asiatica]
MIRSCLPSLGTEKRRELLATGDEGARRRIKSVELHNSVVVLSAEIRANARFEPLYHESSDKRIKKWKWNCLVWRLAKMADIPFLIWCESCKLRQIKGYAGQFKQHFEGRKGTEKTGLNYQQEDEDMLVPRSDLVEGPQPAEVQPEAAESTAENQPAEGPCTTKFCWAIKNVSRLNTKKLYSEIFELGEYKWRILIFPNGNNVEHLSMYLDVADSASLPNGWSRYAQFSLAVVNQVHVKYSVRKETQHQFNARENDWGFTSFMPLAELYDPSRGYLVNDTCVIEAEVAIFRSMDPWLYNSKKETGFVGLKNQGATCYMNSLLQTLYHIPYFRKVVYHMPTNVNDMPSSSIPLALQSLFYKLQYSDSSVATKELTKSFGWDTYDAFLQHDVQELNRVLCEKLEEKMKRTVVEGAIQQLFEGHHMNYIECINVEYKSSRKESFYDLQLDVKGCDDVYASFDKYIAVEHLDGDNKYHAEQYGLQDAKKGVLFIDFPPVLQLHLKRFEYDFARDIMIKERRLNLDSTTSRDVGCLRQVVMMDEYCYEFHARPAHIPRPHIQLGLYLNGCSRKRFAAVMSFTYGLFQDYPPRSNTQPCFTAVFCVRSLLIFTVINDRYEFPLQLDLDRDNGKYLSPEADRRVRNLYTLHSVLVHSGGVHGGHYYAFIRPTLSSQWYKFDDERVTKEDMKKSLEELYGGEEEHMIQTNQGINATPFKFTKHSNAYMLVYIRDSDKDKIMCRVDEKDIAEHLRERLKKEQEDKEQKRKEKAEAHLYTVVKVSCDEDFSWQIGRNVFFDLVDHDKVRSFRVQKAMPFNIFKEEVAKEFGIPVKFQRFWLWAKRQNHTCRPNRPLSPLEEAQTCYGTIPNSGFLPSPSLVVGNIISDQLNWLQLKCEEEFALDKLAEDLRPNYLPKKGKDDILLFFKLYDPEKEEIRYAGKHHVNSMSKPTDILTKLNEMAGYAPDEDIDLYEEIKFEPHVMCELIDKRHTFRSSQLEDGDIVCFQKSLSAQARQQLRCPDVPTFFEHRYNLQVIHFRSLEKPREHEFSLQLSKLDTYDEVVERIAHHLGIDDPSKIRLTSHNPYSQQPKPHPIKYRGVDNLLDMLLHYNQTSDILYYEILDMPLPELQGLRTLRVAFRNSSNNEVEIHNIRVPKEGTVNDVLDDLKLKVIAGTGKNDVHNVASLIKLHNVAQVELSHPEAELRLLEVFSHRIYKIFPSNEKIETINDNYWTLRAEEIPEEERNLSEHDCLIHVYHFMNEENQNQMKIQNFGEPFLLVIHDDETLARVKARVQKKLNVPDEEFSMVLCLLPYSLARCHATDFTFCLCVHLFVQWKFAFVSQGRAEYLEDSDILLSRFQYRQPYEKAVKIYN